MHYTFFLVAIGATALLLPKETSSQIPTVCSDAESLQNKTCCPITSDGVCGESANRGQCVTLTPPQTGYSDNTTDVRANWPHYFTRACQCNNNFGGYDCSRCKFGYYGENCSQFQVLPRRSIHEYSDEDWNEFNEILQLAKTYQSEYTVILEEQKPGTVNLPMTNVSLYNLYVWLHHFTAKDAFPENHSTQAVDYGHFGPAFLTWHRYLNLWLEYEFQWMLKTLGRPNYHTFRAPYWDWRRESQLGSGIGAEDLFTENRLGNSRLTNGLQVVFGPYSGWETICWQRLEQVCDPRESTGPLIRCPFPDRCHSSNPDWPTRQHVNTALNFEDFDSRPWTQSPPSVGFRNYIDIEFGGDLVACHEDRMCICSPSCSAEQGLTISSRLHLSIHFIPGSGDFRTFLPDNETGIILDVAASPNDPLFILHHTMIDCIFEEWLRRHPNAEYPSATDVPQGHRRYGYIVPFFPLYMHNDMFKRTENFGYSCSLSDLPYNVASTTQSYASTTQSYASTTQSYATTTMKIITWPALVTAVLVLL